MKRKLCAKKPHVTTGAKYFIRELKRDFIEPQKNDSLVFTKNNRLVCAEFVIDCDFLIFVRAIASLSYLTTIIIFT